MHAHAQDKILTVISYETPIYKHFYNSLETEFSNNFTIEKTDIAELDNKELSNYEMVISVGTDASNILSRTAGINRLISTLIPGNLSKEINKRACLAKTCSTVLIEQPIVRYFKLFKIIFPRNRTLVIATSSSDFHYLSTLNSIANKYNVNLKIITINTDKVIARSLATRLSKNDVLLALPDPYIYNKDTAKSIILSAYHKNVPIIAYSKAFTKAGALIGLYSSFDDIARKTVNLALNPSLKNRQEYYPETFSIEINHSVARSLNITLGNPDELKRKIE